MSKKTLRQIIAGTFVAGALAFSVFKGLEYSTKSADMNNAMTKNPNYNTNQNSCTDKIIDVSGRWHLKASGGFRDGWCWHWANLWLKQNGTNLSGSYQWEANNSLGIKGHINSNNITLK